MKIFNFVKLGIFYASLTAGIVACEKHNAQTAQGGQDSGGGNTTASSLEEVEFYYQRSMSHINNILYTFLSPSTYVYFKDEKKTELLSGLDKSVRDVGGIETLIKSTPIIIKRNGPCISKDKLHASASIKSFEFGSPICLSFTELTKIPKSSLEREIISLLLHEYAHSMGYDENSAVTIQNALIQNFDLIFPMGAKIFIKQRESGWLLGKTFADDLDSDILLEAVKMSASPRRLTERQKRIVCSYLSGIDQYIISLQNADLNVLLRATPALIDSGEMTENQIDKHLLEVDKLEQEMRLESVDVWNQCVDSKQPQFSSKMRAAATQLRRKLVRFFELIEETKTTVKLYD
jgi:hypothetical protein